MSRIESATCQSENVTFLRKTFWGNLRQTSVFPCWLSSSVRIATKAMSESSIDTNHNFRGRGGLRDPSREDTTLAQRYPKRKEMKQDALIGTKLLLCMTIRDQWSLDHRIEVTTVFKGGGLEGRTPPKHKPASTTLKGRTSGQSKNYMIWLANKCHRSDHCIGVHCHRGDTSKVVDRSSSMEILYSTN